MDSSPSIRLDPYAERFLADLAATDAPPLESQLPEEARAGALVDSAPRT